MCMYVVFTLSLDISIIKQYTFMFTWLPSKSFLTIPSYTLSFKFSIIVPVKIRGNLLLTVHLMFLIKAHLPYDLFHEIGYNKSFKQFLHIVLMSHC